MEIRPSMYLTVDLLPACLLTDSSCHAEYPTPKSDICFLNHLKEKEKSLHAIRLNINRISMENINTLLKYLYFGYSDCIGVL